MKIILLIAEILFTGFMIRRLVLKIKKRDENFLLGSRLKSIAAAIAICIINLSVIIGGIAGLGYIPDMIFLVFVIIELLFGSI